MSDMFVLLPRLSWRGIELPLTARRVERAHEQLEHPLLYKDGELVETTGSKNWTFTYTIPFRENVAKGPYRNLYSRVLVEQFVPAFLDRSPGELVDPLLGAFTAKPFTFSAETDVDRRDGEDVTVTFKEAPEQDAEGGVKNALSNTWAASDAGALDAELRALNLPPEVDLPSLQNPLDAVSGLLSQAAAYPDLVAAKIDDYVFRAEKIESAVAKLENPQHSPVIRSLRRAQAFGGRMKERVTNPLGTIIAVAVAVDTTLSVIASRYGMTLQQLLKLNPNAPMIVKAGSTVKVASQQPTP